MPRRAAASKSRPVETFRHDDARRVNLPSAEDQPLLRDDERTPLRVAYERRNRDLDPQLVWRGKDEQDATDFIVNAPPLFIQERLHPKALIDDLIRQSRNGHEQESEGYQPGFADIFADFNGLPEGADRTEFYQHDANWSNRVILGDSLQVMASLAAREGLAGKVQCIYIDPPYGIKFNSNFQWSTTTRDVQDGKRDHMTREPEQVRAFRDTWREGIHSYLSYLRDRLTVAQGLLTESGSIFVQIGEENVHRVRALMDEIFGVANFVSQIAFVKTSGLSSSYLSKRYDYLLWYCRDKERLKFRRPYLRKSREEGTAETYHWLRNSYGEFRGMTQRERELGIMPEGFEAYKADNITSQGNPIVQVQYEGRQYSLRSKTTLTGHIRLAMAGRIHKASNSIQYVRKLSDSPIVQVSELWSDTGTGSFTEDKIYVVQTGTKAIQRCMLMATDPGDLVLDPTCGSGTTAYVAEQWGRRWITIDTSRVALALARARIMGARYPFYLLTDSAEGQRKEAEVTGKPFLDTPTYGHVRQGFVYERVPHITLRDIANNAEIDVIWETAKKELEPLRTQLNAAVDEAWEEWEIPRDAKEEWTAESKEAHEAWCKARIARQKAIDDSIARNAEFEYLYDKPYEDRSKVRVAGPFTVESISPHRTLEVDENGDTFDRIAEGNGHYAGGYDFATVILENLKTAGVQQAHKEDRISFTSLTPRPGNLVCAVGTYMEGATSDDEDSGTERRAGIFIGPEFGTVSRPDLVEAAREAAEAGFDTLIACAFNYDAHSTEFERLGRIPVLKARMNADLHMAGDLKNTRNANLFVIFGEPDIDVLDAGGEHLQVRVNGVDVFHPNTGEVRSDGPDGIACWFIDTDYNQESFFVRHAYFLGANDPYKSLKTTLRAEIDEEAWETLHSDTSRPFPKPSTGRIAVKVINHLGDEVMKVFRVP